MLNPPHSTRWRQLLHEVIFEAETPAGKAFDVALLWSVMLSVLTVTLDSVAEINARYGTILTWLEWFFTALFSVEYLLRLIAVKRPLSYAMSFFGLVDLLAVLPTYASLLVPGLHYLLTIRLLRLLRVFRVLKLAKYQTEARVITTALRASRRKISVFLFAIATIVVIVGTAMYVIEGESNGYINIPTSIYWAIVTLTTVGYGDISPQTPLGKALASLLMITGYGIIAVPTGIVTAELTRAEAVASTTEACQECGMEGHDTDAVHCKYCGAKL